MPPFDLGLSNDLYLKHWIVKGIISVTKFNPLFILIAG